MMVLSRIKETAVKITILVFFLIVAGFYSIQAQSYDGANNGSSQPVGRSAATNIKIATEVNVDAMPVELGNSINSPYDDIKPRITPCGNRLYFSRNNHPGNSNGVNDPEDIWYSEFDKTRNTWSEPIHMTGVLNNSGPNYINNISATGDTLILGNQYLKKGKMRAGLSYSVKQNGDWSVPTAIDIEGDYNMSSHSNSFVDLKNGVIIRSVERIESIGKRDLFVSFWDGEKATEPVNMGTVINTGSEESSPFLASDNKTLYFASKGHSGYGGYDIYVTKRMDDSWTNWTTPENLGPAVNGSLDDEFFSITHDGNYAIFSKQKNVHNTDLYRISMDVLFGNNEMPKSMKEANSSLAAL
ncbi:MAG: hypothetical protein WD824_21645 [Cyclobacteriaceae bacterium]